jgi:superfamily II DNA or RNA helicase
MLDLRPYQVDQVDRADVAFAAGARAVVMAAPTGSGKTATASEVARRRVALGRRVLFLAHLDSLLEDTHARLSHAGVWAGLHQAGRPTQPLAPVQVCSLQTLHARGERPPADFLILDECHHAVARTIRALLDVYGGVPLLGLTATPQRGDGQPLGDVFEQLVLGPSVSWLTSQGFLVPCDLIAPLASVEGGLAMDPVDAYFEHVPGSRAMVFAKTIAHAEDITARFAARGVAAESVTGNTSRTVRAGLRDRVARGELRALVSVAVFLEGFDLPSVEAIILARGFGTCGAYLQAIGRGLRPSRETGKTRCTVLDLCGSVHQHGLPDDAREWDLQGDAVRRSAEALVALRRCRDCLAIFRPAVRCPRCGMSAATATVLPRVLTRAERLALVSDLPLAERDSRYLSKLEWIARTRIRLSPNAARQWAVRQFIKQRKREPAKAA